MNFIPSLSGIFSIPMTIFLIVIFCIDVYNIFTSTSFWKTISFIVDAIFNGFEILIMPYNFFSGLLFGAIEFISAVFLFWVVVIYLLVF